MSVERAGKAPGSVNELQRRIGRLARERGSTVKRLQALVAGVVLCQVLPDSAVKGGTGLKLRLGDGGSPAPSSSADRGHPRGCRRPT